MAQALVPLKDLVQAKSRLAGLLRPSERRALAQAMAEDVLNVLANHSNVAGITLMSDDPGAGLLAQKYGADCWSESSLGDGGLNALIQSASERLLAAGKETLLVLHADLPLLTPEDISEVLHRQSELDGLIIGCDRHGTGTNLLAFDAASMPLRFCFGADSCPAHAAGARSAGVPVEILQRSGIGVDVDEAQDLKIIMERLPLYYQGHTAQLLHDTGLGARLTLALATVLSDADPIGEVNRGMSN
jgi:2-phospho-L-lactate guanylyltransferase